jgi:hypothetical protein
MGSYNADHIRLPIKKYTTSTKPFVSYFWVSLTPFFEKLTFSFFSLTIKTDNKIIIITTIDGPVKDDCHASLWDTGDFHAIPEDKIILGCYCGVMTRPNRELFLAQFLICSWVISTCKDYIL